MTQRPKNGEVLQGNKISYWVECQKAVRVLTDWRKRNPVYASGLLSLNAGMVAHASIPIAVAEGGVRWLDITTVPPDVHLISYTNVSSVTLTTLSNEVAPPCPQARAASRPPSGMLISASPSWAWLGRPLKLSASEVRQVAGQTRRWRCRGWTPVRSLRARAAGR